MIVARSAKRGGERGHLHDRPPAAHQAPLECEAVEHDMPRVTRRGSYLLPVACHEQLETAVSYGCPRRELRCFDVSRHVLGAGGSTVERMRDCSEIRLYMFRGL